MKTPFHIRTELIIGMTLAEMFLLILFVVWYSQGPTRGPDWERIAAERLLMIRQLSKEIQQQRAQVVELQKLRKFWLEALGVNPPASVGELETALRTPQGQALRQDLARGAPRCDQNNVLVEVSIRYGTIKLRLKDASPLLQRWARSVRTDVPLAGDAVETPQAVASLLASVSRFYEYQSQLKQPCRFDYKLFWATDQDYRRGREQFEKYFYPAGITSAP
jgi:hypothetical protein